MKNARPVNVGVENTGVNNKGGKYKNDYWKSECQGWRMKEYGLWKAKDITLMQTSKMLWVFSNISGVMQKIQKLRKK